MRHVDHAHDAEGDGEPYGRQYQDRPEAEPEKEVLDEGVDLQLEVDLLQGLFDARRELLVVRLLQEPVEAASNGRVNASFQGGDRGLFLCPVARREAGEGDDDLHHVANPVVLLLRKKRFYDLRVLGVRPVEHLFDRCQTFNRVG